MTYLRNKSSYNLKIQAESHGNFFVKNILTDSNSAPLSPIFPDGVSPNPPTKPAHMSDKISPYKFGITSTSYFEGSCTMFKQTVSKYLSSNLTSGYFSAISRQHLKNRPSDIRLETPETEAILFLKKCRHFFFQSCFWNYQKYFKSLFSVS